MSEMNLPPWIAIQGQTKQMLVHNKKRAKWTFRLESLYKDKKSLVLTSDNNNENEIKKNENNEKR